MIHFIIYKKNNNSNIRKISKEYDLFIEKDSFKYKNLLNHVNNTNIFRFYLGNKECFTIYK